MRSFIFIIGALLTLDTAALSLVSNGNLGTVLPAVLGIPLLLLSIFYPALTAWFATPLGHACKVLLICLYGACFLVLSIMTVLLKSAEHAEVEPDRDVLIVLGCSVRNGRPSLTLRYRLDAALAYLDQSPHTTVIVSGGQGPQESVSEARAMADYLTAHGLDASRIILEDQSTSTYENFKFCKTILQERFPGDASVAFVTTGFHVYRSGRVAAMHGIRAEGIPAQDVWYSAPNNYIREGIAVVLYTLSGKLT
ncbi:MAG: YdcF family protein [Clostridia bacterium]|nr:YdcF family protein [Clostridia bacterium]